MVLAIAQAKAEAQQGTFASAQQLGCPCFMQPRGRSGLGRGPRLVPTTQQCPCQLASVLLTSRMSGHGGSAKIPKTTVHAVGPGLAWSSSAQNGQPYTLPGPHRGRGTCYVCPDTWHLTVQNTGNAFPFSEGFDARTELGKMQ